MKNINKKLYIFIIFFITFFLSFQKLTYAQDESQKSVLIFDSYGNESSILSGFEAREWATEITSSINSEFINSKKNIDVNIQYMDTYNYYGEDYWQQLYNLYKYKFKNAKFDAVITLDDNAFKFLLKYGNDLFPNTPVVFSGVNNFNESMINDHPLFTGVAKNPDIQSTVDIALKLHPNTKQVFIITDKTLNGINNKKLIESLAPLYKDKVNFLFSDEENIIKLKEKINSLPKNTIIFFNARFRGNNGNGIPIEETGETLFEDCTIPVYSTGYIHLNKQSMGGMITDGYDYGKNIGKIVLRVLNGEKPSDIPVIVDSSHKYVFNYEQLKKFNINLKSLPIGAEILNSPSKSYNISKKLILCIIATVIFLIISGITFLVLNIYKRRLAEKLLSENESLLRTLINSTPDIIYFKDPEGRFLEVNNSALSLLNINIKNYKNKNIYQLTDISISSRDILLNLENKDKKAWEIGTIYRSEEVIPNENEKLNKTYDTLRIPLFHDDGTHKGLFLLGRDITEHKQIQKNEKLINDLKYYDKLKTNFFSNISHELRTPLNLIFSALQVIEFKNSSAETNDKSIEKYTVIMRQNCYRLLRIIGNLIDITKIDAGHFFTHPENIDIINVVENIVLSVVDYVESKGISITFDTEIEEKVMAFDPDAMERIILNLLSNCVKFTPSGGSIEVNLYDKIDSIVISVKDTGIGIPTEKQSSIFEKFIQVDKSLSRNREGSGIGLSLVKELVVLHNGTIELESTPGKGSEFKIELPINLLPEHENPSELSTYTNENRIEKIKIEFSDIYN